MVPSRSLLRVCLAMLTVAVLGAPFLVGPARAHTPTALAAQNPTVCVNAGASILTTLYNAVTPLDEDWTIRLRIGLTSGGDAVQSMVFSFYAYDNSWSTVEPMGNWGAPTTNWNTNPGFVFQGTIDLHAGGSLTVRNTLDSYDGSSQCFSVYARAFYSSN